MSYYEFCMNYQSWGFDSPAPPYDEDAAYEAACFHAAENEADMYEMYRRAYPDLEPWLLQYVINSDQETYCKELQDFFYPPVDYSLDHNLVDDIPF